MNSRRQRILLSLMLLVGAAAARAEEAPPPPAADPTPQGPVEKVEVRGDAEEAATLDGTAFATVIRAEDFEGRVTSVPELLRDLVGVQVRGLGGEFATVSIRGSTAEQVVVYLDGVPLNRALGGGVNLADLPLGQVDSIEVYRGVTPAGLPAASIGGAVMIHTRRAGQSPAASVTASVGSYGSGEMIASVSGRRERADWRVGLDGGISDGDFEFFDNNGTAQNPADDTTAVRHNNDFQRGHLSGQATFKSGERGRFSLAADLFAREQGVPGLDCCKSPYARFSTSRWLLRPEFEMPGLFGGRVLGRLAADYTRYREEFDDPHGDIGLTGFPTDAIHQIETLGGEAGLVIAAPGRQAISFLLSRRRETADLVDHALPGPDDIGRATRHTTVVTLEDQVSFSSDRLVINPSLRHEAYESDFDPGPGGGVVTPAEAASYLTGKIGFRLKATGAVTVKGNFGRFARLPDFIELFGNQGAVLGNPALDPERGRTLDLGFVATRRQPQGALRAARLELTIFETLAEDLIQFIPNSQSTVLAQNFDRARIRGAELTFALGLGKRFSGSLNFTHQDPRDVSGGRNDGLLLPGRPQDEASASATFEAGRGRVFYDFTYVGPNFIDRSNTPSTALPARYLHDAGYLLRLRPGLQATFEVKNAADEQTYDYARYPLPGRSFHARVSWEF